MSFNARQVREYAGGSIGGILRRGGSASASATAMSSSSGGSASYCGEAKQIDLLVFGYACKVFRDDEKAREIDQGKHLIPWMGDSSLKIDRYDVRGALYDLSPHEAPPGGYGNRLDYITAEEQRAEQLCEEERYLYLYRNEEQHILHQEEELKRFKKESGGYNQVGLQYNGDLVNSMAIPHGPNREDFSNSPTCEEADQVFILPMNFVVPPSIQLPETMKQHAIIEKTARFIGSQGVQMEILLKAKQSNNLQFEFLTQNSTLNPYYKFVLNAIKDGSYPVVETTMESLNDELSKEQEQQVAVQVAALAERPVITVPTIKYKPSANCAYTQLISKIKGVPLPDVIDEHRSAADAANKAATANANAPNATTENEENFTPVLLQYNGLKYVTAAEEASKVTDNTKTQDTQNSPPKVEILKNSSALLLAQGYSSGSETESEAEKPPPKPEPKLTFPLPAENLRNIIDKTASYVIKNGRQFEETLRAKSEERFTFLLADNEYYPYYMYKITGDPDAASIEQKTRKAAAVAAALMSRKKMLTPIDKNGPVCFSIKAKDDQLTPGLPQENSDDDDENTQKPLNSNDAQLRSVPEHVKKAIQLVESQLMARNAQLAAAVGATAAVLPCNVATSMRSRFDVDYNGQLTKPASSVASAITNAELERNAIFEQQQQNRHKELKRAEEKVKDKLAQIAREKLGGLISKEKQLQLERKRKAMAFLNQIKAVGAGQVHFGEVSNDIYTKAHVYVDSMASAQIELKGLPAAIVDEVGRVILKKSYPQEGCITIFQSLGSSENELTPDKKTTNDNGNASDNSDESVHSIPITSYGPEEKTDDEDEPPRLETTKSVFVPATKTTTKTPSTPPPPLVKLEQKPIKITPSVTLSDDDDVQLISETKAPPVVVAHKRKSHLVRKRRSRSRSRKRESYISTKLHKRCDLRDSSSESLEKPSHSTKLRSHKSAKTKKSSHKSHSKKKSKKRSRSRSHSPSQRRSKSHHSTRSHSTYRASHSRYSRSVSEESVESDISPPPPSRTKRHHQQSKRSKEKRRKHER